MIRMFRNLLAKDVKIKLWQLVLTAVMISIFGFHTTMQVSMIDLMDEQNQVLIDTVRIMKRSDDLDRIAYTRLAACQQELRRLKK
jgi:hypothetical protein